MDEESRLLRKFASFSSDGKRKVIAAALGVSETDADQLLSKLLARLQYEESLANYVASKTEIDLKLAKQIDEIKIRRLGKKKKPAKKAKRILLHLQEIKRLRENNISWKDIAGYLRKSYKINASWVWVRNIYHNHKSQENEKD